MERGQGAGEEWGPGAQRRARICRRRRRQNAFSFSYPLAEVATHSGELRVVLYRLRSLCVLLFMAF